ncbi:RHS repeat domain-containing protein [Mucilaginibacter sp. E4BP6]|uniref:RHS repeat domain-containing protein n=1 Tax=Mucilaginibacter sp. E4BP6 TaxID=2723089 RepID=UPI0015CE929E|nr:RHS repeat domain-containing protein [Mucilaginibacter sp. E4BP6]NYE68654.1 YD repeat-containing protein [Mucilaginibacter sp. E4BP6]
MKKLNFFACIALLFFLSLLQSYSAQSQTLPPPTTSSPNAATLEKFTDVPVNLFTGTPDISIPIHTLKYGNISVPISLRYHPSAVRPAQQPGWVGLGWDLQSYGAITRIVRGNPDDLYGSPGTSMAPQNSLDAYYPVPGNSVNFPNASGSELANATGWSSVTNLKNNFQVSPLDQTGVIDIQADEFSFNFMGYSGTFYYEGPTLGWKVVCNDNIKISLLTGTGSLAGTAEDGFLAQADIYPAIEQYIPFQTSQQPTCNGCSGVINDAGTNYQPNTFAGFIMTVPDGTQYVFGGANAIEFESVYYFDPVTPSNSVNGPFQFLANTWLLSQIIDVNHNVVNFTYQRTYPTVNLSFLGFSDSDITASTSNGCSVSNATQSTTAINTHYGHYEWPMYLSQISSPNETISFTFSPATCLRYSNFTLLSQDGSNVNPAAGPIVPIPANSDQLNPAPINGNLNNIQWEQLNTITINNSANNIYREFQFNYSSSASQRLTLNSLSENDNQDSPMEVYSFLYNTVSNMSALKDGTTAYYDGNGTDNWGFFNGQDLGSVNASGIVAARQTDPTEVTTGLLNQITYPTGGYTKLTWEAHDYSQYVSANRQALVAATGYAGGSRIKEIKSFDINGAVLLDKNYIYKAGYTAGGTTTLSSSGVLNGMPQYSFSTSNRQTVIGSATISIYSDAFQPLTNYSYNGMGSYIGYNEVAEVNADGSYTRHFFTNYGIDLNGISHYDNPPASMIGWLLNGSMEAYLPMNTLEGERGLPTGTFQYTSGNTLVQKTNYTYRNDAARFNSYLNHIDVGNFFSQCNPAELFVLESARELYTYDYYPVNKTMTIYDQNGNNPVVSSETYNSYDVNNMLTQKTVINSRGETVVTNYTYPIEATDATSLAMVAAHILTPLIKTVVTNNGNPVSLTQIAYSSPYTNYFLPQTVQLQTGSNTLETREQMYQYDTHGNVQEESKTGDAHDVYLWGYNSQYLVAKITNSTYAAVQAVMASNNITQSQLDNPGTTDAVMRTTLNLLRAGLPNSQVTTYTYATVTGITSETDPKGKITTYQYDSYNRLMNIIDLNGNIVKHYDYHYQGQ